MTSRYAFHQYSLSWTLAIIHLHWRVSSRSALKLKTDFCILKQNRGHLTLESFRMCCEVQQASKSWWGVWKLSKVPLKKQETCMQTRSAFKSVSLCTFPWIFKATPPQRERYCHHKFPRIPTGNGKPQHAVTKTFRVRVEGEEECIVVRMMVWRRSHGLGERVKEREEERRYCCVNKALHKVYLDVNGLHWL